MAVTSNDILQNILLSINTALQDISLTEDNRGALIEQYERTSVLIASGYKYVDIAIDDLPSTLRDESLLLVNDVIDTFNSTFQTLINSQTASHNTLLQSTSSSVSSKIAELQSWKDAFEQNLVFDVAGLSDKLYPVLILTSYQPYEFFISRDNAHWNSSWLGRVYLKVSGFTSHYGHTPSFLKINTLIQSSNTFVSSVSEDRKTGYIIVYLRGNTKYRFRGRYCNLSSHDAVEKTVSGSLLPIKDVAVEGSMATVSP